MYFIPDKLPISGLDWQAFLASLSIECTLMRSPFLIMESNNSN